MKGIICFLIICTVTLLVSCKKMGIDKPPEETYIIKVKEYKTNILLPGVTIKLYRCSRYDPEFGCQATSLFATHATDINGEYKITQGDLNRSDKGIVLSKAGYWDIRGGGGEIAMEPEAWVSLTLKATKNYPDTSLLQLKTTGEFGFVSFVTLKAPKDSTINYRLFGNETNVLNWMLFTKDLSCYQFCLYDTLATGSITFKPQKFERLTSSLNY